MVKVNLIIYSAGILLLLTGVTTEPLPEVFITISANATVSLDHTITTGEIQLNWFNVSPLKNDWIRLFSHDPKNDTSRPLFSYQVDSVEGMIGTKMYMKQLPDKVSLENRCLGYWIAYFIDDKLIASNCFKIQPNWMWENYDFIYNKSLSELMIPGTHDSGSFQIYKGWESENFLTKYLVAQGNNFWNQLAFGIRYFDVRIASDGEDFWLTHNNFRVNRFDEELESIKKFVQLTKEIVIVDFHSFELGFTDSRGRDNFECHNELVSLVFKTLGDLIIPRSYGYNVTLKTLWQSNKRVLIGYNDDFYMSNENLWPGVYQAWANTVDIEDLLNYFSDFMSKPIEYKLWSAQAEFTPHTFYIFINPNKSLRMLADEVNPHITKFFRDRWWHKANIVSTDFFFGNNIIEVCIESNKKRSMLIDSNITNLV